ncbi:phage tail protein [Variovorax sp. J22R193]|uniref:phage tail protein n=1 Tax=Variovorax fucosicus TaxID=3053517 RepID=UPI002575556A|nr:phage tail protein [Variovorax sp. J22R193]MDM0041880.1 phage tail protein [Variovorax sp. J22R193]
MSSYFPNKTILSISSAFGSALTVSAITNANPGVASSTAHGLSDGDIVLASSGWTDLNDRPVRVAGSVTNAFNLEGFDTTSTTRFPAGAGVGTVKEVTSFVAFSQVTDVQTAGGEQQYFQWVYLEDGLQRQKPTFKNARSMTVLLDYDNALAWYTTLLAHDLSGDTQVLRAALPNGKVFYWSVVVGFDGEPNFNINTNMQVTAQLALVNPRSTKY